MISNTVGHFGSCYRTPRADSALCGAKRSDLGKRRAGDGSSKGRRTFFLQRWARAWLGARVLGVLEQYSALAFRSLTCQA